MAKAEALYPENSVCMHKCMPMNVPLERRALRWLCDYFILASLSETCIRVDTELATFFKLVFMKQLPAV